jgi:hypothetical protein
MSQVVSEAVLVVPKESSPPPQPAISATQSAGRIIVSRTFTGAPVYSSRILRRSIAGAIVVAGLLAGMFAQAGGASPIAHEASFSPCDINGKQQDLGASYVTSLKVQGVSCAKGEKVIKAYHQCRHQSGGPAGNCGHKVLGFSCKDGGRTGVPNVQYNATAKCRKASNPSKRVKSTYTQNT